MTKILIEHGRGPVTTLVARGETREVELTPAVEAALAAGLIVKIATVVKAEPKATKSKAEKPVVGTVTRTGWPPDKGE